MVYLEFDNGRVYLKDEDGRRLWENIPAGWWKCRYCGGLVQDSESKCPNCYGGRKPEYPKLPRNLKTRRGILEFTYEMVYGMKPGTRLPLPDETIVYGDGWFIHFATDTYMLKVMSPTLPYQVREGEQLYRYAPIWEYDETGMATFKGWT
jgi:hypothetical protein